MRRNGQKLIVKIKFVYFISSPPTPCLSSVLCPSFLISFNNAWQCNFSTTGLGKRFAIARNKLQFLLCCNYTFSRFLHFAHRWRGADDFNSQLSHCCLHLYHIRCLDRHHQVQHEDVYVIDILDVNIYCSYSTNPITMDTSRD